MAKGVNFVVGYRTFDAKTRQLSSNILTKKCNSALELDKHVSKVTQKRGIISYVL